MAEPDKTTRPTRDQKTVGDATVIRTEDAGGRGTGGGDTSKPESNLKTRAWCYPPTGSGGSMA